MDIEDIKCYVEENVAAIGEVRDIASKFGASADGLRKMFRRSVGIPLSEYIILKRIAAAKTFLEQTDMPCFQVCFKVGFAREDSGLRTFKRRVGMTMIQYRLASRQKPVLRRVVNVYQAVQALCTR